jgi:glucose-6-phosphate isomerase
VTGIEASSAWNEMFAVERSRSIAELFASDSDRVDNLTLRMGDLVVDLSKNLVDDRAIAALLRVASEARVEAAIERLLDGSIVNLTEQRAAGHASLRRPEHLRSSVNGVDVTADVNEVLERMRRFVVDVHSGRRVGSTGRRLTTVVNLGIGGSDLGPAMAYEALRSCRVAGV